MDDNRVPATAPRHRRAPEWLVGVYAITLVAVFPCAALVGGSFLVGLLLGHVG